MRNRIRHLLALAALLLAPLFAVPAKAQELVMFDEVGCIWCIRWTEEIGPIYPKSEEGRRAPLRRVDINAPRPRDLQGLRNIAFTPTFVLMHEGQEVGRIEGYPGEDFFWGLLGRLMDKLPEDHGIRETHADPSRALRFSQVAVLHAPIARTADRQPEGRE